MRAVVLLIFDWRDGPVEGVLASDGGDTCWHFKLIAERLEVECADDRLFGLWAIPSADCSTLVDEFGDADSGTYVWPAVGGIGSNSARKIVDGLLSAERNTPVMVIRAADLAKIQEVWKTV